MQLKKQILGTHIQSADIPGGKATEIVTLKVTGCVPVSSGGIMRQLGLGLATASALFPSGVKDANDKNEVASDPFSGCLINCDPD